MTWPTEKSYGTTHLDASTDSPAQARADLKLMADDLEAVIEGRGQANGVASLDAGAKVPLAQMQYTPVNKAGDTMAGDLNMGGNQLKNIDRIIQFETSVDGVEIQNASGQLETVTVDTLYAENNVVADTVKGNDVVEVGSFSSLAEVANELTIYSQAYPGGKTLADLLGASAASSSFRITTTLQGTLAVTDSGNALIMQKRIHVPQACTLVAAQIVGCSGISGAGSTSIEISPETYAYPLNSVCSLTLTSSQTATNRTELPEPLVFEADAGNYVWIYCSVAGGHEGVEVVLEFSA